MELLIFIGKIMVLEWYVVIEDNILILRRCILKYWG